MRIRRLIRNTAPLLTAMSGLALTASPALAHETSASPQIYAGDFVGQSMDVLPRAPMSYTPPQRSLGYSEAQRERWLADCRGQYSDNGVGGALIGGVLGGIAGNRIAGRRNRTVGTIAGAAIGAVAGAVIDKAEDRGRVRDECEDYLARYEAGMSPAYGRHTSCHSSCGHTYNNCGCRPAPVVQTCYDCQKPRTRIREEVYYEWVDEEVVTYERVPVKTVKVKRVRVPVKIKQIKRIKYTK